MNVIVLYFYNFYFLQLLYNAFYVINYVVGIILILYYVNKYHSMLLKI